LGREGGGRGEGEEAFPGEQYSSRHQHHTS